MTGNQENLVGKRVTVIGLGVEGVDLVRFLVSRGARVTVSDAKPPERLAAALAQLEGLPVAYSLGANRVEDVLQADAVFVSQSVPLNIPPLAAARERGIPISSMMRLFLHCCPGPVVGITGSSGKTTTTSLVGAMFAASGRPHVVAGNIGVGPLALLDTMTAETWAVLEISHTQLELTDRSPHIAAVLNVTPNHLDRYAWPDYVRLKQNILRHQRPDDVAVLNVGDPESAAMRGVARGQIVWFGSAADLPGDGAYLCNDTVCLRWQGRHETILRTDEIPLRGRHNIDNVLAAAAISAAAGIDPGAIARGVRGFRAVPHRLEFVAEIDGATYYNDSIATTPERTLAGMRSFKEPLVLLLGGREKHLPLDELAAEAVRRCRAVICFGEAGPLLESALRVAGAGPAIRRTGTLAQAVEAARQEAHPGDVVLLSPACTSFDAYDNFERRGEEFRRLVLAMAGREDT